MKKNMPLKVKRLFHRFNAHHYVLILKLAKELLYVLCRSRYRAVEVYPIEVYHVGKGAVEVSGLPPMCQKNKAGVEYVSWNVTFEFQ